jgi:citrate synthase
MTLYGAPESLQGAVAAGLLGVGDRFAGTASETARLLEQIVAVPADERESLAQQLVQELRQQKKPVPGFGHPVHKQADPRVARLLEVVQKTNTNGDYISAMFMIETALAQNLGKKLPTNISAAIAAVLCEAGVPAKIMRGIVLTARCAGLVGHLLEEMDSPAADAMWDAVQAAVPFEKP